MRQRQAGCVFETRPVECTFMKMWKCLPRRKRGSAATHISARQSSSTCPVAPAAEVIITDGSGSPA